MPGTYLTDQLEEVEVHLHLKAAAGRQHRHILEGGHRINAGTRVHGVLTQQVHQHLRARIPLLSSNPE